MTLSELLTEVYTLTDRSDLVAETTAAIKAATLKIHMRDFFLRDVAEVSIVTASPAFIHQIDYIAIISNFRALKYLRKYDVVAGEPKQFLDIIEIEEVLDSYGRDKVDVCYLAGRTLNVKSSTEIGNLVMGCYVLPIITDAGYSSWVAEQFPYTIIYEATRTLSMIIGDLEQSKIYAALGAEQIELLMRTAITNTGY